MLFLIFALVILVFLSLVQKYYSLAVFYPMLGGLLFGSWLLTMNSYHPHEISWGINEYVQDCKFQMTGTREILSNGTEKY